LIKLLGGAVMILRAEITTDLLAKLAAILSAVGTEVILHFSPGEISMCITGDSTQVRVWAGASTSSCFNKHEISSRNDDTISLKTQVSQLAQTLSSGEPSIQMALRRENQYTFLHLTHKSLDSLKQLQHRVPVLIVSPATVSQYAEPAWERATMAAKFPSLRAVLTWCQNAKSISNYLLISISRDPMAGTIDVGLRVENDVVNVATKFADLGVSDLDADADFELVDESDVLVDLKKFLKILKVNMLQPVVMLLYVYDKKSLRLHFGIPAANSTATVTYVLGAISR
jgi:hypothetical protein